jgi:hypothetical protein
LVFLGPNKSIPTVDISHQKPGAPTVKRRIGRVFPLENPVCNTEEKHIGE